jgi:hypothetical protein
MGASFGDELDDGSRLGMAEPPSSAMLDTGCSARFRLIARGTWLAAGSAWEEYMDRPDEKRDRHDDDAPARVGDTLGLGGSSVPKSPRDPSASDDPESVRRRHERMTGEDEDMSRPAEDPDRQRSGATGIDMGSGGEGTDISGR